MSCTVPVLAHTFAACFGYHYTRHTQFKMNATTRVFVFFALLTLAATSCKSGAAAPTISLGVSTLPSLFSVSPRITVQPNPVVAVDTFIMNLPTMVE